MIVCGVGMFLIILVRLLWVVNLVVKLFVLVMNVLVIFLDWFVIFSVNLLLRMFNVNVLFIVFKLYRFKLVSLVILRFFYLIELFFCLFIDMCCVLERKCYFFNMC